MARRYDSSTTTFSPEGRLHQVCRRDMTLGVETVQDLRLDTSNALAITHLLPLLFPIKVEYAIEAINNAGTCVGILAKDGIVMASERRITSGLLAPAKVGNGVLFCGSRGNAVRGPQDLSIMLFVAIGFGKIVSAVSSCCL